MTRHIASVSWGKDSLAMVLRLIEEGYPLDEVAFYDTGAEFDCIYKTMEQFKEDYPHIKVTTLRPKEPFFYQMFARPVKKRGTGEVHKHGYGWCGGVCRWGTDRKQQMLDRYCKDGDTVVYVGIAADEERRASNAPEWKSYPLIEWGMTEADCLRFCYERGYDWDEGGVMLYDILDRVSCWCCRNKNQKELRAIHDNLPQYWERLNALEDVLGQMKSKPLSVIGGDDD